MAMLRPWQRDLSYRLRGKARASQGQKKRGLRAPAIHPVLVTLLAGLLLGWTVITALEARLRPIVAVAAQTQTKNTITAVLEHAIIADLGTNNVSYDDLITIERNQNGTITALTTNMAAMNLLRARLIAEVLQTLSAVDVSVIQIPLGSLLDSELVWARGPSVQVRAMSVGSIVADFESEFSAAGVNQTCHRIVLDIAVPITVLLPGGEVQVPVTTQLCVAETIIVGQVPDTYLQFGGTLPGNF